MLTVDIHKAQTDLPRLADEAVKGKSFLISKAGKPLVKVIEVTAANEKSVKWPTRADFT
jgi:antitoxin (DNA-binding transcriptional repressor) of toxin-antitoxin stability system